MLMLTQSTGLALYGEFLEHNWRCWIYTAYATIAATIVQVGMIALFQVWGIPMSNISYTTVCIMFMTARKSIPGLQEKVGEQVPSDPTELRKKEFAKRRAVSRFMKV
jgi:urea transporter